MLTVAELGEGDMFGEMALIERGICSASIIARSAVEGWFVARDDFRALVASRDPAALETQRGITRVLAEKLRALNARVRDHPADEDRLAYVAPPAGDPLRDVPRSPPPPAWRSFFPLLPFFERFDAYDIEELAACGAALELPRGAWLFAAGSRPMHAFSSCAGRRSDFEIAGSGKARGARRARRAGRLPRRPRKRAACRSREGARGRLAAEFPANELLAQYQGVRNCSTRYI